MYLRFFEFFDIRTDIFDNAVRFGEMSGAEAAKSGAYLKYADFRRKAVGASEPCRCAAAPIGKIRCGIARRLGKLAVKS